MAYPDVLLQKLASGVGVVGINPLLVGQDGTSLIPDGTAKEYIYSNKKLDRFARVYSDNSGASYGTVAVSTDDQYYNGDVENSYTWPEPTGRLDILPYTSKNNPYIQTTPKPVVEVEPKVIATNSHSIYKGALVGNQVSGKIQVGNGTNGYESKVLENLDTIADDSVYLGGTTSYSPNSTIRIIGNGFNNLKDGDIVKYIDINASSSYTPSEFSFDNDSVWEHLGKNPITTTPKHSTLALDSSISSASKYFYTLEQGEGSILAGVNGMEMVWDYTADELGEFTLVTAVATQLAAGSNYKIDSVISGVLSGLFVQVLANVTANLEDDKWYINSDGYVKYLGLDTVYMKVWDGNGFGDSNDFKQLTNGTTADLNGNTVRTFHGSIPLNIEVK